MPPGAAVQVKSRFPPGLERRVTESTRLQFRASMVQQGRRWRVGERRYSSTTERTTIPFSRRRFLTSAAAGVAALSLPTDTVLRASERLNVGCISTGGPAPTH